MTRRPPPLSTLAIGSLPHTQLELAMQQALSLDVLTLPQLTRCATAEFMLPQALEGLPGLRIDADGRTSVDRAAWERGAAALRRRLDPVLSGSAAEEFEPSAEACRAWKPFLWEVQQRALPLAKAQIAGPTTVRWATRLADGKPLSDAPGLEAQMTALVLARALAMTRALRERGAQPLVFFDEPALFALDPHRPTHAVELAELRMAAAALRRAGALVGVHCCGNTDWSVLMGGEFDYLSMDVRLSGRSLAAAGPVLDGFLERGGAVVAGVVPTGSSDRADPRELLAGLMDSLGERTPRVLATALLSPACGLALRSVAESEAVYADVRETQRLLRNAA